MSIEKELERLEYYRDDYEKMYDMLLFSYNIFLENQTEDSFKQLVEIFEKNKLMNLMLSVSSTIVKANRIIEILLEEKKLGYTLFTTGVTNFDDLINKFTCTIFAIRRIEFESSNEMVAEAERFLLQNNISPCAIVKILTEEVICDTISTLNKVKILYENNGKREFDLYMQKI